VVASWLGRTLTLLGPPAILLPDRLLHPTRLPELTYQLCGGKGHTVLVEGRRYGAPRRRSRRRRRRRSRSALPPKTFQAMTPTIRMVGNAVPIMVGNMVVIDVANRVSDGVERMLDQGAKGQPELCSMIAGDGDGPRARIGLGAAGTPAPGRVRPMPSPGGNYHPARKRPASSSFLLAATPAGGTVRWLTGGCGGSSLTPGRAGWSQRHWVGRSARRAAAPAGRGRCRAGLPATWPRDLCDCRAS
jgi:hypothetical protein